jgi:hypothetical protein
MAYRGIQNRLDVVHTVFVILGFSFGLNNANLRLGSELCI